MSTSETKSSLPTVNITEAAAHEIKRHMEQAKLPDSCGLKVGVSGGGCSGLQYTMNFMESPEQGDKVFEEHGIRLFVDIKSFLYLQGTTLDFSGGLNGKGFIFTNPNANKTCGCGSSFSV
ncbi:HesB/IscA family protein [candidate division KSB1 bacterium]